MSALGLLLLCPAYAASLAPGDTPPTKDCRCAPDQWEGLLSSFDREFDLHGGRSAVSDSQIHMHYDYENRLFAMIDASTGSRALADYGQVSIQNPPSRPGTASCGLKFPGILHYVVCLGSLFLRKTAY